MTSTPSASSNSGSISGEGSLLPSPMAMTPPISSVKNENLSSSSGRLPMIVDISIDNTTGREVYQVYETKKLKQNSNEFTTPVKLQGNSLNKSKNFHLLQHPSGVQSLQALSGNGLNKRHHFDVPSSIRRPSKLRKLNLSPITPSFHSFTTPSSSLSDDKENSFSPNIINNNNTHNIENEEENSSIWSEDIEAAFAEALSVIPKKGLTKIKLSGKSCGRNELISDFIFYKTGKLRARKQVSSHIQVIKKFNKDPDLIELITKGPLDPNAPQKFNEIFGKIFFQKSIGGGNIDSVQSPLTETPVTPVSLISSDKNKKLKINYDHSPSNSSRFDIHEDSPVHLNHDINRTQILTKVAIDLRKFQFTYVNIEEPFKSHIFSKLKTLNFFESPLRIKKNANLSKRFPELFIVSDWEKEIQKNETNKDYEIPILHGLVNTSLPDFANNDLIGGNYETNININLADLPISDNNWSCLTIVYSFGRQVLSLFDDLTIKCTKNNVHFKNINAELKFAPKFWESFFSILKKSSDLKYQRAERLRRVSAASVKEEYENDGDVTESDEESTKSKIEAEVQQSLKVSIRGITIKQVIFNNPFKAGSMQAFYDDRNLTKLSQLHKLDIRSILLWEFNKVDDNAGNIATFRQIHLPREVETKNISNHRSGHDHYDHEQQQREQQQQQQEQQQQEQQQQEQQQQGQQEQGQQELEQQQQHFNNDCLQSFKDSDANRFNEEEFSHYQGENTENNSNLQNSIPASYQEQYTTTTIPAAMTTTMSQKTLIYSQEDDLTHYSGNVSAQSTSNIYSVHNVMPNTIDGSSVMNPIGSGGSTGFNTYASDMGNYMGVNADDFCGTTTGFIDPGDSDDEIDLNKDVQNSASDAYFMDKDGSDSVLKSEKYDYWT
ncbi:hypothetical protein PACTADRAFT_49261 [Pachysolen tannophilus NRRL Y-2460]|uniref:TEA domain-containing protein n=1 Tax=Pachysolen tannophilus NRRL Y-2460 TaxID=669874 RepID=A0A1E4TVK3_PACTA|nr:hypothetical protein PACTADRAFT_49261 [Pachysolen tannophilus NRRL Y-2460]